MDYEKLMLKIKNEYFPELKDIDIPLKPISKSKFRILNSKIFRKIDLTPLMLVLLGKIIYYNDELIKKERKKYNRKIIIAVFAHELAHVVQNKKLKWNLFQKIFYGIKYYTSTDYRSKNEKEADRMVIKRGLGKELIMSRKGGGKLPKKIRERRDKTYYTEEELKKLVYKK